jgi:hypothetical protein
MLDRVFKLPVREQLDDISGLGKLGLKHVTFDKSSVESLLSMLRCFIRWHMLGRF